LGNSAASVAALAAGSVDIASSAIPNAALAHAHGIPIRFIAPAGIYTGPVGNTIAMVSRDSTIKSGADLARKTVAVGALKDLTQFEMFTWIDRTGGDSTAVRFVELPYAAMAAALDQGRADAAVLIEPYITAAKKTAKVLANLSDTVGGPYLVTGWVSTEDWIRKNPDQVKRFIAATQRTALWANRNQKISADILIRYAKIQADVAATMNRIHYLDVMTIDPATIQRTIDLLVKYGALAPMPAKDLIAS
jgi:NitT/TauT family transport system substrate-binding protein